MISTKKPASTSDMRQSHGFRCVFCSHTARARRTKGKRDKKKESKKERKERHTEGKRERKKERTTESQGERNKGDTRKDRKTARNKDIVSPANARCNRRWNRGACYQYVSRYDMPQLYSLGARHAARTTGFRSCASWCSNYHVHEPYPMPSDEQGIGRKKERNGTRWTNWDRCELDKERDT